MNEEHLRVSPFTVFDDYTAPKSLLSVMYMGKLREDTDIVHMDSDFKVSHKIFILQCSPRLTFPSPVLRANYLPCQLTQSRTPSP